MKVFVNPKYAEMREEIVGIPQGSYETVKVFRNERNTVELIKLHGEDVVMKRYKRPTLFNCFVYTFLRHSKARRSYDNAFLLKDNGFETAEPIAYIEKKKWGFFHTGWYLSRYLKYPDAREYYATLDGKEAREDFGTALLTFANSLFRHNIIYKDYNPGNILVHHEDGKYHFALVDINRMKVGKPTIYREMKAFVQYALELCQLPFALTTYSRLSGYDIDDMGYYFFVNRRMDRRKQAYKRRRNEFLDAHKRHHGG